MIARTFKTLLFLLASVPVAAVALGVLIAGWVAIPLTAITPLVVPVLFGYRAVVGGVTRVDGELANELLGTDVHPGMSSPGPRGFWRSAVNVLGDVAFWRQQVYLIARMSLGFAVAVAEWTLLGASLSLVAAPIWYRWTDAQIVGDWHVNTLGHALLCVPVGIVGVVIALALIRPIAALFRSLVNGLLGDATGQPSPSRVVRSSQRRQALMLHAIAFGALNSFLIAIWAFTGRGYFWPEWTLIALGLPLAIHAWVVFVEERPDLVQRKRMTRAMAFDEGLALSFSAFFVLIWAVTGGGYFWPLWPILAIALVFTIHAGIELARRGSRISELEASRAGAVDQQETELARIERDLHDGAQARLVALGMSLGMAEQKLESDPAAAQELLAEARQGTREALEELRSLARGIHPPVLADRGLEAAISALASRTPLRVNLAVDVPARPPRAVETAAYFVVAEALANTGKHANAQTVDIDVHEDDGRLVVAVVDDGDGGADPAGSGLRGLVNRVHALDGSLEVTSPAGGPTTVRAVIPCGS
ncbi:MAG TPA: sensor histidine kinase [Gaiellaceae bacterium]|nr:sensor histidine kinase [Gaiellaceae bacterium]